MKIDLQEIQARLDANKPPLSEHAQTNKPLSSETLPGRHPIRELWVRMAEMYGHQWASQQGDEPNDTWIRGLQDLTPEQYGTGLRALLDRQDDWPPNLVQFRQLCTGHDSESWKHAAHKPFDQSTLIEDKTGNEAKQAERQRQIKKLREEVGL